MATYGSRTTAGVSRLRRMRSRTPIVPPEAASRLDVVATFKPAYLIHGDDHGRIGERRARLRAIAEAESGTGGGGLFEGDTSMPEAGAVAPRAVTLWIGGGLLLGAWGGRSEGAGGGRIPAPPLPGMGPG